MSRNADRTFCSRKLGPDAFDEIEWRDALKCFRQRLLHFVGAEVRILYQPYDVSERVFNIGNFDTPANVLDFTDRDSRLPESLHLGVDVIYSPNSLYTCVSRCRVRDQAKLKASNFESNVECLIEIRLTLENKLIPLLCLREVRRWIKCRSETFDHNVYGFMFSPFLGCD